MLINNIKKLNHSRPRSISWTKSIKLHCARILKRWSRSPYSLMPVIIFPLMLIFTYKFLMSNLMELITGKAIDSINMAIQISVTAMFTAGVLGSSNIVKERREGLMNRLSSLPGPKSSAYFGRILAESLRGLIAVFVSFLAIYLLGGRFINTNQSIGTLLMLVYVSLSAGFFAVMAGYTTNTDQGSTSFVPLIMINMFLSTSNMTLQNFAPWLRPIVKISPTTAIVEFSKELGKGVFSTSYFLIFIAWFTFIIILSAYLINKKINKESK